MFFSKRGGIYYLFYLDAQGRRKYISPSCHFAIGNMSIYTSCHLVIHSIGCWRMAVLRPQIIQFPKFKKCIRAWI
jgi:hypothetical protein